MIQHDSIGEREERQKGGGAMERLQQGILVSAKEKLPKVNKSCRKIPY